MDTATAAVFAELPRLERARGRALLGFKRRGEATVLDTLHQEGTGRIRLPLVAPGAAPEAILINTGGGMTGGDRFGVEVALAAGTHATVTTQACEKIYRARDGVARIDTRLTLAAGAELDWLPQETILFDRGALERRVEVVVDVDSRLTAVEAVVLGRTARGETVESGRIRESWRIRRAGGLVYADAFALGGPISRVLARPATANGARAFASIVHVAPDAEARLDGVREAITRIGSGASEAGASAWNGLLAVRLLAQDGAGLRRSLVVLLEHILGRAVPRVWHC